MKQQTRLMGGFKSVESPYGFVVCRTKCGTSCALVPTGMRSYRSHNGDFSTPPAPVSSWPLWRQH